MKTANPNFGLGDARSARRKVNKRVKHVDKRSFELKRGAWFRRNLRFAAAAKAYRTAHDVTQAEIAAYFGRSQTTVCSWENGFYSWPGGTDELNEYCEAVRKIAI